MSTADNERAEADLLTLGVPLSTPGAISGLVFGAADDLFEYQAIAPGGWVMLDKAGCAV
jgi:hypothetical protein